MQAPTAGSGRGSAAPRQRGRADAEREARWAAWMAAAQQGDAPAYETLLRDLRPLLRDFVRRRIDEPGAEDVVQTVLLSLHRARHTYRQEQPFAPWLWAIARNAVTDARRRHGSRQGREEPLPEDDALYAGVQATRPPAEDGRQAGALPARDLERALARLPAIQREAVVLLHLEGLSVNEAAVRARVSPGALKVRAHRAYRALRALLEERTA